jgi:hypothetical protein
MRRLCLRDTLTNVTKPWMLAEWHWAFKYNFGVYKYFTAVSSYVGAQHGSTWGMSELAVTCLTFNKSQTRIQVWVVNRSTHTHMKSVVPVSWLRMKSYISPGYLSLDYTPDRTVGEFAATPRRCVSALRDTLTPWSRGLAEKLTGPQLVMKFPAFYGTRRFITAITRAWQRSLAWTGSIQSIIPYSTFRRSILILSFQLRLGFPSGLLPSGFTNKNPCCTRKLVRRMEPPSSEVSADTKPVTVPQPERHELSNLPSFYCCQSSSLVYVL